MRSYLHIKTILDYVFAAVLLMLLLPIMACSAAAIMIGSKGPVLFRQQRPGKDGKIFTIYKFRTMQLETEQGGRRLSDMERMTSVGRLLRKVSIDELPQLFNILSGKMSFIGPRPLLVQYLDCYTPEQRRRHEVKPGITGWAQVNGRNTISWEDKFKLDVWYVDNVSFKLDVKIFFMTIANVLSRKGINQSEADTMEEFVGNVNKLSV
ncbi:sugar transferase [Candidatus Formimonas warabiya]|uniref:Lipid carrier--UDP-N-acetylgalactosaminyltransferase n=1 Tax=Formimonas warabiya TaxID=1761012 RepID=A0A3G1KPV7_FORW1|nr:sugar transferase [Candidatus Formimonas warabiya]ATW24503.1 lipid carrier--UDP-N-acetylgalactosaminyltransferase [Candidatus Formimonas warabiya]